MMGHKICLMGEIWLIILKLSLLPLLIWGTAFLFHSILTAEYTFQVLNRKLDKLETEVRNFRTSEENYLGLAEQIQGTFSFIFVIKDTSAFIINLRNLYYQKRYHSSVGMDAEAYVRQSNCIKYKIK